MDRIDFDCIIVGGGAIGLACAFRLAEKRPALKTLLIERNDRLGAETSARNSEVIHAGIYYAPGSLKEKYCLVGKPLLYEFCQKHGVPHRRCGKLIVGSAPDDDAAVAKILAAARRNDVPLEELGADGISRLEPRISGRLGLLSPTSGIIDAEAYVQRLARLAEDKGVTLLLRNEVVGWSRPGGYELEVSAPDGSRFTACAPRVVNAAGLHSLRLASPVFGGEPPFEIKYVRGRYLTLSSRYKGVSSCLVYPLPDTKGGGLGIHLTIDLEGNARLGPDIDWSAPDRIDYSFTEAMEEDLVPKFVEAARHYLPELKPEDLHAGFVGIRPKLVDSAGKMLDFYVAEESARGHAGWVNLIGIESPGLTASLAIADEAVRLL